MIDQPDSPLPAKRPVGGIPGNKHAVRLNPKVRAAIAYRLTNPNSTWKSACKAVECSERTLHKAKASPHFRTHFQSLARDKLFTEIVPDALHVYGDLIRSAESDYVRADLAKDALAQAGVRDRLDGAQRPAATGGVRISFITVNAQNAQIVAQDVVRNGIAVSPEDERND